MSPEHRSWKYAYDEDPEHPAYPPRDNLTIKQKNWLKRAWTWASVAFLGFEEETIPDAIPRYNEQRGWFHVPAIKPDLNHIDGVGESTRLDGNLNYNDPRNIAPVSRSEHTGVGVSDQDAEDMPIIIHQDTWQARKKYGKWKKEGGKGKNPMILSNDERRTHTDMGDSYHDSSYDRHMKDTANEVVSRFTQSHPEDPYPKKKDKKPKWVYDKRKGEWVQK